MAWLVNWVSHINIKKIFLLNPLTQLGYLHHLTFVYFLPHFSNFFLCHSSPNFLFHSLSYFFLSIIFIWRIMSSKWLLIRVWLFLRFFSCKILGFILENELINLRLFLRDLAIMMRDQIVLLGCSKSQSHTNTLVIISSHQYCVILTLDNVDRLVINSNYLFIRIRPHHSCPISASRNIQVPWDSHHLGIIPASTHFEVRWVRPPPFKLRMTLAWHHTHSSFHSMHFFKAVIPHFVLYIILNLSADMCFHHPIVFAFAQVQLLFRCS